MIVSKFDIADCLAQMAVSLEHTGNLMDAILTIAETEDCPATIVSMASVTRDAIGNLEAARGEVAEWCRAIDMERIEREKVTADLADTGEVQAMEVAHKLALELQAICEPAMRACYALSARAEEIDALSRHASGLTRHFYALAQGPQPAPGSLQASLARPSRLSDAVQRLRERTFGRPAPDFMKGAGNGS